MSGGWFLMNEDGSVRRITTEQYVASGAASSEGERRIGWTEHKEGPNNLLVSTVFLGLDHAFGMPDEAQPLAWETMVCRDGNWDDDSQVRYRSLEDAFAGHQRIVWEVFGGDPPPTRWGKYVYTSGLLGEAAEAAWRVSNG